MKLRMRSAAGFSILEMMISMAIMMVVTGAIFTLVNPSQGTYRAQPEVSDMQQRMRVATDMLFKDLLMAGAGTYQGSIAGSLTNYFAPILPYKSGANYTTTALTFDPSAISLTYVPNTASQTAIAETMPSPSSEIKVSALAGCPKNDPLCGFEVGMRVVIFDATGAFDAFTITAVQSAAQHLQHAPPNPNFSKAYSTSDSARISQMSTRSYYLNSTTNQLMFYDGYQTEVPLVDNVVGLTFKYYGDPNPPLAPKPLIGVTNCLYDISGNPTRPVLTGSAGSLVELASTILTDGPACGTASNTFDADLYRVRKVRVTLRVQAASDSLRGADTTLFARPGTSKGGATYVPDYEMSFEVSPRNMNLTR